MTAALTWHRLTPRHYTADHPTLGAVTLRDLDPGWVLYWQDPALPHTSKGRQRTPTGKEDLRAARAARTPEQVAADAERAAADRARRDAEQDRAIAARHNDDEAARRESVAAFRAEMAFVAGMD